VIPIGRFICIARPYSYGESQSSLREVNFKADL
jgi:hypothetical protein